MSAVTVQHAVVRLSAAVEDLWSAVGELALIVMSDQPDGDGQDEGLAVADQLLETVSEIQGAVADARDRLARASGAVVPGELAAAGSLLLDATHRYWRDVRAHRPVAHLRASTRRRGGDWPAWADTVEQSAARCAEPFDSVAAALDLGWQEICRLALADGGPRNVPSAADPSRRIP